MFRNIALALFACIFLATAANAAELKIGVADMARAGSVCEANAAARNKYEKQFNTDTEKLTKDGQAFEKKMKDFETQSTSMNQADFEKRRNELQNEMQKLRQRDIELQQKIGNIQNAITQELAELAVKAAADVAKAKNLDLVLAQNSVLFVGGQIADVTDDVIASMNKLWKAGGSKVPGDSANK